MQSSAKGSLKQGFFWQGTIPYVPQILTMVKVVNLVLQNLLSQDLAVQ